MATVARLLAAVLQPVQGWQKFLLHNWEDIAGGLYSRARIERIQGDVVVLGVYDPHWMHELHFLSAEICQKINARLDEPYVKQVRLVLARARKTKETQQCQAISRQGAKRSAQAEPGSSGLSKPVRRLTAREQSALASVQDEQLQEALRVLLECS